MVEAWTPNLNCRSNYTAKLEKKYRFGIKYNTTHKPLTEFTDIPELYQEIDPREPIKIPAFVNMDSKGFEGDIKKRRDSDQSFSEYDIQY